MKSYYAALFRHMAKRMSWLVYLTNDGRNMHTDAMSDLVKRLLDSPWITFARLFRVDIRGKAQLIWLSQF